MAVKVRCPECEKSLTVPDTARGKAVKCPACQARIPIPAAKAVKKKEPKETDSADFLANLDLKNVEDRKARICPKCGADVHEEDIECPECGIDLETGGLGVAARKKLMKGPDPDKYYATLWKDGWEFVGKNQVIAWRTTLSLLVTSLLAIFMGMAYLYISPWPPRYFFALCTAVCFLVGPGWLWYVNSTVIDLSLERKDKFPRFPFDFFLSSALGIKAVLWHVLIGGPVLAIPALIGYYLTETNGMPGYVFWICLAVGYLPLLSMAPISMSHMAMPIDLPGWLIWKILPAWGRLLKPAIVWTLLFLATNLWTIAGLTVVAAVYGESLQNFVQTMEQNAEANRQITALARMPDKDKQAAQNKEPPKPVAVDYSVLIVPTIIYFVSILPFGFTMFFNMRTNGQFAYYFRDTIGLIGQAKQKTYKAILPRGADADDDLKPKTTTQVLVDSLVVAVICVLLGGIGGMLYSAIAGGEGGMLLGIAVGAYYGGIFAAIIGRINLISAGFQESVVWGLLVLLVPFGDVAFVVTHWDEGRSGCLTQVLASVALFFIVILAVAGIISGAAIGLGGGDAVQSVPMEPGPADAGLAPAAP